MYFRFHSMNMTGPGSKSKARWIGTVGISGVPYRLSFFSIEIAISIYLIFAPLDSFFPFYYLPYI